MGRTLIEARHLMFFCRSFGFVAGETGLGFHFNLVLVVIEADVSFGCLEYKIALFGDRVGVYRIVVFGA